MPIDSARRESTPSPPAAPVGVTGAPAASRLTLRRELPALATVVVVSLAIQLPLYDRWISLLDEGNIALIADQMNHGGLPYRDGVHLALPGVFYLLAGLFRVFGPSFIVGRWVMVVAFTALTMLVYVLARMVASRPAALFAALLAVAYRVWAFPHWQMISYSSLAVLMLVAAAAVLAADLRCPRTGRLVVAGLLAGTGIVFKQDSAGFGFAGLAMFTWLDARAYPIPGTSATRRTGILIAAATIPLAMICVLFWRNGELGEMVRQTMVVPLFTQPLWGPTEQHEAYLAYPLAWPPLAMREIIRKFFFSYLPSLPLDIYWPYILGSRLFNETLLPVLAVGTAYLLPWLALLVLAARELWRARSGAADEHADRLPARRLRLLLATGAAVMLTFNRPRDWIHLMVLYPPTLILLAPMADLLAGRGGRRRVVMGAGAVVVAASLALSFVLVLRARAYYAWPVSSPRAGVFVEKDEAVALTRLVEALAPPPGAAAPLAALPYHPALNFLTGRPPVSRYLTILPHEESPQRQEEILGDLTRTRNADIVYSVKHFGAFPPPQYYVPHLYAGMVERFQLGPTLSDARTDPFLFARVEPRTRADETVLYDFAAAVDEGRLTVVPGPGGPVDPAPAGDVSIETWPFERPVITFEAALAPAAARLEFVVRVSQPARLRFGTARNPDMWSTFLEYWTRFIVRVDGRVVFDRTLDPRRNAADRRWIWSDVPVPEAGEHAIAFEMSTESRHGVKANLGGWARARLVADEAPPDA